MGAPSRAADQPRSKVTAAVKKAGVAERSLTHANAAVRTAVLHDVCEVHGNEKRDQLDAEDRAPYASILKELQRSLDAKNDPEGATQTFCEFGRGLQKP